MSEKLLNIHQRLAKAMGDVDYIQKEKKQGMNYSIVSHDSVTAKVRPVLLKHGIVYYPVRCDHVHNGNRAECSMTIKFVNIDDPMDFFEVPTFGYGIDAQDKGPGKAMSYAVKYALLKALGLETGDDPDEQSVEHNKEDVHKKKASAAEMKRSLEEIDKDLLDCDTINKVNVSAKIWASVMERDGWSDEYRNFAKPKFAERRDAIKAEADDAFPGDKPNVTMAG